MSVIREILSADGSPAISSKRVVTLLAFLLCAAAFISETWFETKIDVAVFNSLMYIVIGGLGFTASEKFAPK